jgi:hypothetical protein
MHDRIYDEASKVSPQKGTVVVDGPDGVAVTLSVDAALETSDRLLDAATEAEGQKLVEQRAEKNARKD